MPYENHCRDQRCLASGSQADGGRAQHDVDGIIEAALRRHLEATADEAHARPRLRRHSFRGRGLQPGLSESDWATIRERAYESRGG